MPGQAPMLGQAPMPGQGPMPGQAPMLGQAPINLTGPMGTANTQVGLSSHEWPNASHCSPTNVLLACYSRKYRWL